jgi:hypothetical protein
MRVISGFGCFLWGSLAVLLAPLDAITALGHSHAVFASPELKTTLADPDARADLADAVIKVPLVEPEVSVSPLEAADECLAAQDCIDQYLWATRGPSDGVQASACGSGSTHTARNLGSADPISIKIRRTLRRSTVKNMPISAG